MQTEYRVWLTVMAQASRPREEWEDLLDTITRSPVSRGPVMSCDTPAEKAGFTVSYPAEDAEQAGRDSIAYVREGIHSLGWLECEIRVDEVAEIDLEAELLE